MLVRSHALLLRVSLKAEAVATLDPADLCKAAEQAVLDKRDDKDIFKALSSRAIELAKCLNVNQASRLIHSMAQARSSYAVQALVDVITQHYQDVSVMQDPSKALPAFCPLSASDVRKIVMSLSRLKLCYEELLQVALDQAVHLPPDTAFTPIQLTGMLQACARLGFKHNEFFTYASDFLLQSTWMPAMPDSSDLLELLAAIARMSPDIPKLYPLALKVGSSSAAEWLRMSPDLARRWLVAACSLTQCAARHSSEASIEPFLLKDIDLVLEYAVAPQLASLRLREILQVHFALVRTGNFSTVTSKLIRTRVFPMIKVKMRGRTVEAADEGVATDSRRGRISVSEAALILEAVRTVPFKTPLCEELRAMAIDGGNNTVLHADQSQSASSLLAFVEAAGESACPEAWRVLAERLKELPDRGFEKVCDLGARQGQILEELKIERVRRNLRRM